MNKFVNINGFQVEVEQVEGFEVVYDIEPMELGETPYLRDLNNPPCKWTIKFQDGSTFQTMTKDLDEYQDVVEKLEQVSNFLSNQKPRGDRNVFQKEKDING